MAAATDRIEIRLDPEMKRRLESAAELDGVTLSAFAKQVLIGAADARIERHRRVELDVASWESFVNILDDIDVNDGLRALVARPSVLDTSISER